MKEAQEEPKLWHELENVKQVLGAIEDVRGRGQSLGEQVAQQHEYVAEWRKQVATEKATEGNKKLGSDLHSMRYEVKKLKMKGKERVISGGPERISPIERGA
jgi:4-aminobutyrate aminotransferase-like enzyme